MLQLDKVISVCCATDAGIWEVAAPQIIRYISADRYEVIVPDGDIELFRRLSPREYFVLPETLFVSNLKQEVYNRLPARNKDRCGWYLQQFIKLRAIENLGIGRTALIWDADTVPLRPLSFIDASVASEATVLNYYFAKKRHKPYFEAIKRITGLSYEGDHSFIAQCIPVKGEWAESLFDHISKVNEKPWVESLLENIDFNEASGFSEYETLGTFFSTKFPLEFQPAKGRWLRFGNQFIGTYKNLNDPRSHRILREYAFASFEKWERPWPLHRKIIWELFK